MSPSPVFYGWWVTAAFSVMVFVSAGVRHAVGPFLILGVIFLVHQTGAALGSWLAGALFESTGGYGAAFAVACVLLAAAGLVSLRVDREPRTLRWAAGSGARA